MFERRYIFQIGYLSLYFSLVIDLSKVMLDTYHRWQHRGKRPRKRWDALNLWIPWKQQVAPENRLETQGSRIVSLCYHFFKAKMRSFREFISFTYSSAQVIQELFQGGSCETFTQFQSQRWFWIRPHKFGSYCIFWALKCPKVRR